MPTRRVKSEIMVDRALRDEFLAYFPGRGSLQWVLETALREMLDQVTGSPNAVELVRRSIRLAITRSRQESSNDNSTDGDETGVPSPASSVV